MEGMIDYSAFGSQNNSMMTWGQEDTQDLLKALTAGTAINSPGAVAGSGFPLRMESLDSTLYNVSYSMKHLKLWPQLIKEPVFNTINEYNTLQSHGTGVAFFHTEGDLPPEDDSTWLRNYATIRHMGTTRRYSLTSKLMRFAHGDAETHQTIGGTLWTLRQLERALFTGSNALLATAFDGYDVQIAAGNVWDLRGRSLTGDDLNYVAGAITEDPNFGMPTDVYYPIPVHTDLVEDIAPNARYQISPQGWAEGRAGMSVRSYETQAGQLALNQCTFLTPGGTAPAAAAGDAARRPGAPTEAVALAAAGAGSEFTAADAGNYRYRVIAYNRFGRSTILDMTGAVAVAAGQQVTFSVADGSPVPEYYEVYRTNAGGAAATATFLFRVARNAAGVTQITDTNAWLPGTSIAYVVQQNREFNVFQRLLPFTKVHLGMIDASFRFMLLLFGCLVVHTPNKAYRIINIGRTNRAPAYDRP